jgi:hypothetical protein
MWLNKLKIAIAQRDLDSLNKLVNDVPKLDKDEMQSAIYLLKEASLIVEIFKESTLSSMQQIRKNLDFLNSTKESKTSGFDVTF